jgi:hypothetical protein
MLRRASEQVNRVIFENRIIADCCRRALFTKYPINDIIMPDMATEVSPARVSANRYAVF